MTDRLVLVVGFGPFLDVVDNPASRLARAVDGHVEPGLRVVGRTIPVSWRRAPVETLAQLRETGATELVGVGVARGRSTVALERTARPWSDPALLDVDDEPPENAIAGARCRVVSDWAARLGEALGADVSDDAGRYLCNWWLYTMLSELPTFPLAFLHIPPDGMEPGRLLAGLSRVRTGDAPGSLRGPELPGVTAPGA
jgi:pyroglutamyl-peptidase